MLVVNLRNTKDYINGHTQEKIQLFMCFCLRIILCTTKQYEREGPAKKGVNISIKFNSWSLSEVIINITHLTLPYISLLVVKTLQYSTLN